MPAPQKRRDPRKRRGFGLITVASVAAVLVATAPEVTLAKEIRGIATVLSGDEIAITSQKVRLFGIKAPSRLQTCRVNDTVMRCGIVAWAALIRLADGAYLSCDIEKKEPPQKGAIFATCYAGEHDIAEDLVRSGWAKPVPEKSVRYKVEEGDAKQAGRGLWGAELLPYIPKSAEKPKPTKAVKQTPTILSKPKGIENKPISKAQTPKKIPTKPIEKVQKPVKKAPPSSATAKRAKKLGNKKKAASPKAVPKAAKVKAAKKPVQAKAPAREAGGQKKESAPTAAETVENQEAANQDNVAPSDEQKKTKIAPPEEKSFLERLFGAGSDFSDSENQPEATEQ
ncbi:MAG: thermonuclease family protein [Proteobacteria bacterium]|nr:thermonuclease family protein [Pseudomonadota bacterium]